MTTLPSPQDSSERISTRDSRRLSIVPFVISLFIYGIGLQLLSLWQSHVITHVDYRAMYSAGVLVRTDPLHLFDISRQNAVQNALISRGDVPIPFFHPSYEAFLYAPFSLLNYHNSFRAFQVFNLFALLLCFLVGRNYFSDTIPFLQPRPGLMFFPFIPLFAAFAGGQDSVVVLLLLCCAFTCLRSGHKQCAGMVTALALFKFQFVLIIGLLLITRWGKRFAIGFMTTAIVLAALSIVIVGPSGAVQYLHVLERASLFRDQGSEAQLQMAIHPLAMTNLNALFFAAGTRYLAPQIALIVVGLASICLLGWSIRKLSLVNDETAFSIAVLCGLLISGHLYIHDLSLLLIPLALIGSLYPRSRLACYCVPALVFLFGQANATFLVSIPLLIFTLSVLLTSRQPEAMRV